MASLGGKYLNKRQRFIELMSDIDSDDSNEETIEKLGIPSETFYRWLASPRMRAEIKSRIECRIDGSLRRVWGALIRKAAGGDTQSAKLILEYRKTAQETDCASGDVKIKVRVE